ncbi:MAG: hydrogenase formation protein HypD [Pseudomonadota bacterium]
MKYLEEYRDPEAARRLAARIRADSRRPVRLMEVCGTHTVGIFRHGIRNLLPETVTLISGPGCPVCVTSTTEIDQAISLAGQGCTVATFGDLMRVPGSRGTSLSLRKAEGADVRVVYSAFEALKLALAAPSRPVVLLAVGFETTAPTVAATLKEARRLGVKNFSIFCAHKTVPPALEALLRPGDLKIDGFICPGHVTSIIGIDPYRPLAAAHGTPCVVAGFEPVDILQTVLRLVQLIEAGRPEVEVQYRRGVAPQGNPRALATMWEVFEAVEARWRGLGSIPGSGLAPRADYRAFDAAARYDLSVPEATEPKGCACGDVLRGIITPPQCPLFGRRCDPRNPVGPCMVSSEGTCAAYYNYAD